MTGRKRKPARRAQVELRGSAQLAEDGGERRGAQRMLHRFQHFFRVGGEHEEDARDIETQGGEAGAIGRAIFDTREVMTNPENLFCLFARERAYENAGAKAACRRRVTLDQGRYFMERAAHQTAAKGPVDFDFTERQRARIGGRPGKPLDRLTKAGGRSIRCR